MNKKYLKFKYFENNLVRLCIEKCLQVRVKVKGGNDVWIE